VEAEEPASGWRQPVSMQTSRAGKRSAVACLNLESCRNLAKYNAALANKFEFMQF